VQAVAVTLSRARRRQAVDGATEGFGKQDDQKMWSGWIPPAMPTAGERKWQFHAPFPSWRSDAHHRPIGLVRDMAEICTPSMRERKKTVVKDLGGVNRRGVITTTPAPTKDSGRSGHDFTDCRRPVNAKIVILD